MSRGGGLGLAEEGERLELGRLGDELGGGAARAAWAAPCAAAAGVVKVGNEGSGVDSDGLVGAGQVAELGGHGAWHGVRRAMCMRLRCSL